MCGAVPCIISLPPRIILLLHVVYVAIISRADCLHTSALLHYAGAIRTFAQHLCRFTMEVWFGFVNTLLVLKYQLVNALSIYIV